MAPKTIPCIPGAGVLNLETYNGQSVERFCAFGYGKVGDQENHCAHFVAHVLNIQFGMVCSDLLEWNKTTAWTTSSARTNERRGMKGLRGASTRVDEIYNRLVQKGDWDARTEADADCLIFVTIPDNIDAGRKVMGTRSKKHVGIHTKGNIYHYGNSADAVRRDAVADLQTLMKKAYGPTALFLWGKLPDVGDACAHAGEPAK